MTVNTLFHQRSLAMGWLDDRASGTPGSASWLPVHALDVASRPAYPSLTSSQTPHRFTDRDPLPGTPVQANINNGRDRSTTNVATQLDRLRGPEQTVFVSGSHHLTGADAVMTRPSDDSFWNGPPTHRLVPHGELSEWSCDAIGWLAEVIADCAAQLNVLAAEQL